MASHASSILGDEARAAQAVIFSDSREGAAEIAAGVENEHFSNLVRQLVLSVLTEHSNLPD